MKTKILTLLGIALSVYSFSQSEKSIEEKPKGMRLVSEGTFSMDVVENKKTVTVSISIPAFWMSDEVTNKEYREFVNFVSSNPNKVLIFTELKKIVIGDSTKGIMKDSVIMKKGFIKYSKIASELIDSFILERENKAYKNYFTDEKFNDYPVVGVSNRSAVYYCIWKTEMENEMLKQEGKPLIPDYRLPTEDEWAYVASQPQMGNTRVTKNNSNLLPSKEGIQNLFGLFNISTNVSEWTSSYPKVRWSKPNINTIQINQRIVRGGSWKTSSNINESAELDQDSKKNYIGFRIIRPYLMNDKK